ncbi:MAG: aldo/keto reductase [Eubacterium sp.]|nr:aldo/keto reductase [Candidatus Colimonas fimequi]
MKEKRLNMDVDIQAIGKNGIILPDGSWMPKLGQGTWQMAEDDSKQAREIAGLQHGLDIGMNLIDTAEMYADGKSELITGQAIKDRNREDIYIVSKVYPQNACREHIYSSVQRSLKLLGTDYLDMYLLHWREDADLAEVAWCMEDLKDKGFIRRWGVSNFDVDDMEDLWKVPDGDKCTINQILYNLGSRGIEYDLLQWQRDRKVPFMAYCPVGQAGALTTQDGVSKAMLMNDANVKAVAERHGISIVQLLLAFVMRLDDMVAIPKAVGFDHIDENRAAADIVLTDEDLAQLEESFPAPTEKVPMEKY